MNPENITDFAPRLRGTHQQGDITLQQNHKILTKNGPLKAQLQVKLKHTVVQPAKLDWYAVLVCVVFLPQSITLMIRRNHIHGACAYWQNTAPDKELASIYIISLGFAGCKFTLYVGPCRRGYTCCWQHAHAH